MAEAVERLSAKRREAQTLGAKRDGIKMSKSEALASIKTEALALQIRYPAAAPLFAEFVTEPAKPEKRVRNLKDPRPLPDKPTRARYSKRVWELLPSVKSDREVARQVIAWARERGEKDPAGFGRWRILGESALQKIAGKLRNDWAKERAKRKKK